MKKVLAAPARLGHDFQLQVSTSAGDSGHRPRGAVDPVDGGHGVNRTRHSMPYQVGGWRQFRRMDVEFHERLTVLTGANGSGKTSILNVLARHFGWMLHFVDIKGLNRTGAR